MPGPGLSEDTPNTLRCLEGSLASALGDPPSPVLTVTYQLSKEMPGAFVNLGLLCTVGLLLTLALPAFQNRSRNQKESKCRSILYTVEACVHAKLGAQCLRDSTYPSLCVWVPNRLWDWT